MGTKAFKYFTCTILLLCIAFGFSAYADPAKNVRFTGMVNCVQKQLAKLDLGNVKPSGSIDAATLAAYSHLQNLRGINRFNLSLSPVNAVVICKQLGVENFRLRSFWPSLRNPAIFTFAPETKKEMRDWIAESTSDGLKKLHQAAGIRIPGTLSIFTVSGQGSANQLRALYRDEDEAVLSFVSQSNSDCASNTTIAGSSYGSVISICQPEFEVKIDDGTKQQIKLTLFHELYHAAQFQLAGMDYPVESYQVLLARLGPNWLLEGSAEYFSISQNMFVDFIHDYFVSQFKRSARKTERRLSELAAHDLHPDGSRDVYELGMYAAFKLASKHGDKSLSRFYSDLGLGLTWEQSFHKNFEATPDEFYEEFEASNIRE